MGIGVAIAFIAAGLILVLDVINVGTKFVDEGALGWILVGVGVLGLLATLALGRRSTQV